MGLYNSMTIIWCQDNNFVSETFSRQKYDVICGTIRLHGVSKCNYYNKITAKQGLIIVIIYVGIRKFRK